tara:strand:- start:581 stop:685 length:105 start_codon:yes stop_codon:yes gene_type:complete
MGPLSKVTVEVEHVTTMKLFDYGLDRRPAFFPDW